MSVPDVPPSPTRSAEPVVVLAFANDRSEGGRRLRNLPQERRAIQQQLEGRAEVEILSDVRLDELWKAFEREDHQGRIQVFHFAGHASGSWLAFEDEAGTPVRARAGGLAGFLGRQPGLVLAFLNGCSTQEQVQRLRAGVPAVVATTDAIRDEVAAAFAERFYAGLVAKPLRRAFLDAEDFIKSRYGDDPSGVTREAVVMPTSGASRWPWVLDCDEALEQWRLGDGLRVETAAAETPPSARWAARGLLAAVLGLGMWIGMQRVLDSKEVDAGKDDGVTGARSSSTSEAEPEPEPEPEPPTAPFEMTLVRPRAVPAFCIATTEMTQARWKELGGGTPSQEQQSGVDDLPVNTITWVEALEMANRLSARESLEPCYRSTADGWSAAPTCEGYRLPTNTEWSALDDLHGKPTCANANVADWDYKNQRKDVQEEFTPLFGELSPFDCGAEDPYAGDGHGSLAPVGSMAGSGPFGLKDLQGNVAEWVWDDGPRDAAIVRGHSFAWPGDKEELKNPRSMPAGYRNRTVGVRYARRPLASTDPDAAPRCPAPVDGAR